MAKFHFRLTALQRIRESHRDELRSKLAEAYQAETLLNEQAQAVHDKEKSLLQQHRNILAGNETDVNRLLDVQRYATVLKGQLITLQNQAKMLNAEIEKRRRAVVEADQQVRVLEKLHERQLAEHKSQVLRAEAKVLDEIASQRRRANC